jgi:hypothetical protein
VSLHAREMPVSPPGVLCQRGYGGREMIKAGIKDCQCL